MKRKKTLSREDTCFSQQRGAKFGDEMVKLMQIGDGDVDVKCGDVVLGECV